MARRGPKTSLVPTPGELRVLAGVAAGRTNCQVAADLHIGLETVKSHLKRVTVRLGALSRTHAVALCYERGLLPLGGSDIYDRPDDEGDTSTTPPPGWPVGAGSGRTYSHTHPGETP